LAQISLKTSPPPLEIAQISLYGLRVILSGPWKHSAAGLLPGPEIDGNLLGSESRKFPMGGGDVFSEICRKIPKSSRNGTVLSPNRS